MLYTLEKVGVVGAKGDCKPATAPMISRQVGKVDRLVMLHRPPHGPGLFILDVGTIADLKRPLRKCLASYRIHADRITRPASRACPADADVTPAASSFSRIPMLIRPCRAAWA